MNAYLLYQAVDYEGEWFQDGRQLHDDKDAIRWVEAVLAEPPTWGKYADQIVLKRVTPQQHSQRLVLADVARWDPNGWGEGRVWKREEAQ